MDISSLFYTMFFGSELYVEMLNFYIIELTLVDLQCLMCLLPMLDAISTKYAISECFIIVFWGMGNWEYIYLA